MSEVMDSSNVVNLTITEENRLSVNDVTVILNTGEQLNIESANSIITVNHEQLVVLTEPGIYKLDAGEDGSYYVQTIHGGDFRFSGNYVVNIKDCKNAVNLIKKEIPLLSASGRVITMSCEQCESDSYLEREKLFSYDGLTLYSCNKVNHRSPDQVYDAVVIGAGPYGTSSAISLSTAGMSVYWAGETLSFWLRNIQPTALRSVKAATDIYTGKNDSSFLNFCHEYGIESTGKIKYWQFLAYYFDLLVKYNLQPEHEKVTDIKHINNQWHVTLESGSGERKVVANNVINATGIGMHPYVPPVLSKLPEKVSAHVSKYAVNAFPEGKKIAVVGGAQSAIEYALEADCYNNNVTMYVRDEIVYRNLHEPSQFIYRYLASNCEKIINYLPVWLKTKLLVYLLEGTCDPEVKEEIRHSGIKVKENISVINAQMTEENKVLLSTNSGEAEYDLVISATGYSYDINNIAYLNSVIDKNRHIVEGRFPDVNENAKLKRCQDGMYFTGYSCLYGIGFKSQFINGTNIIVKRIVDDIKRAMK